jgi:hypothetical protein
VSSSSLRMMPNEMTRFSASSGLIVKGFNALRGK